MYAHPVHVRFCFLSVSVEILYFIHYVCKGLVASASSAISSAAPVGWQPFIRPSWLSGLWLVRGERVQPLLLSVSHVDGFEHIKGLGFTPVVHARFVHPRVQCTWTSQLP